MPIGTHSGLTTFNQNYDTDIQIWLESEYYNVEVEFTAQETETNMQKGQIYLSAKFTSYKIKE